MLDPEAPLAEGGRRPSPPADTLPPPYPMAARAVRNSFLVSHICAYIVLFFGTLVLVGWALGIETLTRPISSEVPMWPNEALSLVLLGASLLLLLTARKRSALYRAGQGLAAVATLGSLLTLADYAFGSDLGTDRLLFWAAVKTIPSPAPGRLVGYSVVCFLLFGSALLLLDRRRGPGLAQGLATAGAFVGFLGVVPYVYLEMPSSAGYLIDQAEIAVHTAVALMVLGVGVLLARPDRGPVSIVISDTAGGSLARRALPVSVGLPLLVGWLVDLVHHRGLYSESYRAVVMTVASAAALSVLTWVAARSAHISDTRRQQARGETADLFSMNPGPALLVRVSDLCFVDVNDAFARTFGYARDDVIGRSALDLNLLQDPTQVAAILGLLRDRGAVEGFMTVALDRDGRPITVLATLCLVEINAESHVLGIFQDISELMVAEEEVRRSARRLETLSATGRAILAARSTEEIGHVGLSLLREHVECKRATLTRLDPASQELEVVALISDDETEVGLGERFPLSAAGDLDTLLRGETNVIPDTLRIEDPSIPVQRLIEEGVMAIVNIPVLSEGKLVATLNLSRATPGPFSEEDLLTAREVADLMAVAVVQSGLRGELQSRAEDLEHRVADRTRALTKSEVRFRSVLANSPDATLFIDPTGIIELANEAATRLFGYEAIELLGMSVEALVPESSRVDHRAHQERYFNDAVARPMGAGLPLKGRRKDGSEFDADISLSPIAIEAQAKPGVVALVRDMTERKRVEQELMAAKEEAERANRAKDEFLSRMSHELRTPMNSVLGFAQLMEMDIHHGPHVESVKQILMAGRHLLGLIDEVLDTSRVSAGKISISPEPVAVGTVVVEAVELVRPLSDQRGISIRVEPVDDLHVQADRQRISQVLINLLSNAVKYNREGGEVRVSWAKRGEGRLRISVADTGPGIRADEQHLLFVPFERLGADDSTVEGTGLGLTLSKRLVEAMGGTIGMESEVGRGSVFTVELALAEPPVDLYNRQEPSATVLTPRSGPHGSTSPKERTVLYIEDNISNLALVERVLKERTGVRLLSAMQGQVGLDLARQHVPDLILLDIHLPDLRGETVLRRLREDDVTARIPVAVLSADATPGQKRRLLAMGADEYLTKPLDLRAFLEVVDRSLSPNRKP